MNERGEYFLFYLSKLPPATLSCTDNSPPSRAKVHERVGEAAPKRVTLRATSDGGRVPNFELRIP